MKRTISLMMSLIMMSLILLSGLPSLSASAMENEKFCSIQIYQGTVERYSVLRSGDELFFSGQDLARLSGYEYENDGNCAVFTRGCKTVQVYITQNRLLPMEGLSLLGSMTLPEPVRQVGDSYYFPGSQLLPWLNLTCWAEDGIFYVAADAVSIWDFAGDFDPDTFVFDYLDCCEQLDVSGKWLKASAYTRENGLSMVLDLIPISLDTTYGSYADYYAIFDELFQNKESSVYALKALTEGSSKRKSLYTIMENLSDKADLPDELQTIFALNKALSLLSGAADLTVYYNSFQEDNSEKLAMMEAISLNRAAFTYPEPMVLAAINVHTAYENLWDGLLNRLMQDVTEGAVDALLSPGEGAKGTMLERALSVLGVYKAFKPDWVKGMARVSKYDAIASCGRQVYLENFGRSHPYALQLQRCHAMLFLYASEQNWRTMADYAQENGKDNLATIWTARAEAALEWHGKFLASSGAAVNDSHAYGDGRMKELYTGELLEIFAGLNKAETPDGDFAQVEYALLLSALTDAGLQDMSWILSDGDSDGTAELYINAYAGDNTYIPTLLLADVDSGALWSFTHTGAAGDAAWRSFGGEPGPVAHKSFAVVAIKEDIYSKWNGVGWSILASYSGSAPILEDGSKTTDTGLWYGQTVSCETFIENERRQVGLVQMDSPDLSVLNVSGDSADILRRLDSYFSGRDGCEGTLVGDIDGDSRAEHLYLIRGAGNLWLETMDVENSFYDEKHLSYVDDALTVISAHSGSGGVTLRLNRLNAAGESFALSDGLLNVDGTVFRYSDGQFSKVSSRTGILDLAGMTYAQIRQTMDSQSPMNGRAVVGNLGSAYLTITFSAWDGDTPSPQATVLSISASDFTGGEIGSAPLHGSYGMGSTVREMRVLFSPSTTWSPLDRGQSELCQTHFTYRAIDDRVYQVVLGFDGTGEDARLGSLQMNLVTDLTPEVSAALGF